MLVERAKNSEAQWSGKFDVVDRWLEERTELLVRLKNIVSPSKTLPSNEDLQAFCQVLMDYLSAGHFEVYGEIVRQCEKNGPESLTIAEQLYPQITDTTDVCVSFNDKFTDSDHDEFWQDFDKHLSKLAEVLAERIELEDKLIQQLHEKH
jgi:regulator of sigma D